MVQSMHTVAPKSNDPCWCGSGRKFKRCHKVDPIRPGRQSARRIVPDHIELPPYAHTGEPSGVDEPMVRPVEVIDRMRRTGAAAAQILAAAGAAVGPGVTTDELDQLVHDLSIELGGYPSPLNYRGFPKSVCTSVNEVVCHGIPDDRALADGDIVNIDVTLFREGVHGDTNATFLVGRVDPGSARLVTATLECLEAAIAVVRPGAPFNAIGAAIDAHAEANGFSVVREFVGHGIGQVFHGPPHVLHYYDPAFTLPMEEGMTFTIEPMINQGNWPTRLWDDGWTAVTTDGLRSAQFEHTLVVTAQGAEVLTQA